MPQTPHVATHFTSSENIRDIVIGMSDGLTVPFALAAGLSGVVDSTGLVVTAGLAEVAAGAIAMGLGGYLAARTDAEHYDSEYAREERETFKVPEVEMEEVASIFRSYGLPETTVTTVAEAIRSDRRRWIEFMMKFELGVDKPNPARARVSALTIGHLHGQEADPQRLADGGRRGAGGRGRVRDCEVDCVAASIIIPSCRKVRSWRAVWLRTLRFRSSSSATMASSRRRGGSLTSRRFTAYRRCGQRTGLVVIVTSSRARPRSVRRSKRRFGISA